MESLKKRILEDAIIKKGNIIKVDSFLNHQMDTRLLNDIGKEIKSLFADKKVTKIITIEASGIGIAVIASQYFDYVPVVFAKKAKSANLDDDCYTSKVKSYTKGVTCDIQMAKRYLNADDHVLIVDDFLAEGQAMFGLIDLVKQSGATLVGCVSVIEKGYQNGGRLLREQGIHLESLAIIESADENGIKFKD